MCSFYGSTNAWCWQMDALYVHSFHVSQNSNTIYSQGNQITRNRWLYKFGSSVWICFVLLWVHEILVQIGHTCIWYNQIYTMHNFKWRTIFCSASLVNRINSDSYMHIFTFTVFSLYFVRKLIDIDLHNKTKIHAIRWNDLVFALEFMRFKLLSDALCSFINDNFNSSSQIK